MVIHCVPTAILGTALALLSITAFAADDARTLWDQIKVQRNQLNAEISRDIDSGKFDPLKNRSASTEMIRLEGQLSALAESGDQTAQ